MTVVNGYGVCNWYPEHGFELVAESDREAFAALHPAGKVFQCIGIDAGWLVLQYGSSRYRVNPKVVRSVTAPAFSIGQEVNAGGKTGSVVEVLWHFKNEAPIYFLEFGGKVSTKRYAEDDLAPT